MNAYSLADSSLLARLNGFPVIDLAANLQAALPGGCRMSRIGDIRAQSWELALADGGPLLLEVNYGGDLNLVQLGHGSGVLNETYAQHLRRNGDRL